eukprot:scaffold3596_cov316-Prasinococcus_capsulatus_cf.AAC.3
MLLFVAVGVLLAPPSREFIFSSSKKTSSRVVIETPKLPTPKSPLASSSSARSMAGNCALLSLGSLSDSSEPTLLTTTASGTCAATAARCRSTTTALSSSGTSCPTQDAHSCQRHGVLAASGGPKHARADSPSARTMVSV